MDPIVLASAGIKLFWAVEVAGTSALAAWLIWPWLKVLVQPATVVAPSQAAEIATD